MTDIDALVNQKVVEIVEAQAIKLVREQEQRVKHLEFMTRRSEELKQILVNVGIPESSISLKQDATTAAVTVDYGIIKGFHWHQGFTQIRLEIEPSRSTPFLCSFEMEEGTWKTLPGALSSRTSLQEVIVKELAAERVRVQEYERLQSIAEKVTEEIEDRDRRLIDEILRPELQKAARAANLTPWPEGLTVELYKLTYCVGAVVDENGQSEFDYRQIWLWQQDADIEFYEPQRIRGWNVLGQPRTVIISRYQMPELELIECSSYGDLPPSCLGFGFALEGVIPGLAYDDDGGLCEATASTADLARWEDGDISEIVGDLFDEFCLPDRKIRKDVLDKILSFAAEEDG